MKNKSVAELGLRQIEITVQIVCEPDDYDRIVPVNDKLARAIAEVLELSGRFRVNPYRWNFSQDDGQAEVGQ